MPTPITEATRFQWPQIVTEEMGVLSIKERQRRDASDTNITMAPMQIRTFVALSDDKSLMEFPLTRFACYLM